MPTVTLKAKNKKTGETHEFQISGGDPKTTEADFQKTHGKDFEIVKDEPKEKKQ